MSQLNWWNLQLGDTEFEQIQIAFRQKKISYNSIGHNLEKKIAAFLGVKHVLLTTSGSTALLTALKALNIGAGDEVIVPNRTFQATANAVVMAGAQVKLVDVDTRRATLNVSEISKHLTNKTKAIIPVHLNGRACEMQSIVEFSESRGIRVIEDAAQAFASKLNGKYLGTWGEMGCFSMGTTKFLTTGQGGFVVTNNSDLYQKAQNFIFQGFKGQDDKTFDEFGFNFRLSDILSSMALTQMDLLHEKEKLFLNVYSTYREGLAKTKSVKLIDSQISEGEIPIWIEVLTPFRDSLFNYLKSRGIESYKFYPSLHRSPYLGQTANEYPASQVFEAEGLILPCGPHIPLSDCRRVIAEINTFEQNLPI